MMLRRTPLRPCVQQVLVTTVLQGLQCHTGIMMSHCCCRWAPLFQAGPAAGLFHSTLPGLDAIAFSLPIDIPSRTSAAATATALLSSAGNLIRRQQSNYHASSSGPSPAPLHDSSKNISHDVARDTSGSASHDAAHAKPVRQAGRR